MPPVAPILHSWVFRGFSVAAEESLRPLNSCSGLRTADQGYGSNGVYTGLPRPLPVATPPTEENQLFRSIQRSIIW